MTEAEIRARLVDAIHRSAGVLDNPRFTGLADRPDRDVAFVDLGLDSLAALEVCLALEEEIGVPIDPGDLLVHPTVNALATALFRRSGEAPAGPG
ncbi:MAG TPA: acyl carrier protein [Bauldia sp.]|nr:acyl carrier protein [Bauldia sp.]